MRIVLGLSLVMVAGCATPAPLPFLSKASFAPPEAVWDGKAEQRKAVAKYYPQLVKRSIGREQTIFFVTTPTGRVQRTDVIRGVPPVGPTREALFWRFPDLKNDPTVRQIEVTIFEPGEAGQDKLIVIWARRTNAVA